MSFTAWLFHNFLAGLVLVFTAVPSHSADIRSAREVMQKVEANQRVASEEAVFELMLMDKSGFQRHRLVREFRRREPSGVESSLIFFEEPPDIRGSGLLSKERQDGWDDQWLYLPAVGKIRRIADSGRTDYFLGTDLTFEDFSVEDIDRCVYAFAAPDTAIDKRLARVIDAIPADTASRRRSGYGLRRVFVDAERYVILKTEYYDRAGRLIKVLTASDVSSYGNIFRANRIFVENFQRKHRTDIQVTKRSLSENFPADLFTPRTLRRGFYPEISPRPPQTNP